MLLCGFYSSWLSQLAKNLYSKNGIGVSSLFLFFFFSFPNHLFCPYFRFTLLGLRASDTDDDLKSQLWGFFFFFPVRLVSSEKTPDGVNEGEAGKAEIARNHDAGSMRHGRGYIHLEKKATDSRIKTDRTWEMQTGTHMGVGSRLSQRGQYHL